MNTLCISTLMLTPEKGDKIQGVPSTSKSRRKCPLVHPRIYGAHAGSLKHAVFLGNCCTTDQFGSEVVCSMC